MQIDNGEEEELLDGEALKIDIKEFSYMQGRREGLVEMKSKIIDYLCDEQLPLDFGVHAQCDVLIEGMLTGADVEDKSITLNRRFHRESDFKIVPFVVVLRSL
ncbi:MAG: hypothetical protein HOL01_01045 [Planctomycetaceae bacterium]|nr:hypothetical protein [Planctomycetaceae bacterium]